MITILLLSLAAVLLAYQAKKDIWAAVLVAIFLIPTYIVRISLLGIPTNVSEIAIWIIVTSALLASNGFNEWAAPFTTLPRAVKIWSGLFLVATVLSTLISPHLRTSLGILKGWVITPMAFAWVLYALQPTKQQLYQALYALIASATAISAVAWCMGFTNGRLQAIYDTPNSLALYVVPILVATLWHIFTQKNHRPILIAAASVQAAAVLGSQSVAGVASLLVSLAVASLAWLPAQFKKQAIVGVATALMLCLLVFWGTGKLAYLLAPLTNSAIHNSATVRLQLWSVSWQLVKENIFFGLGLGTFEPAYQERLHERFARYSRQPIPEFVFRDPHNWILSFWLNTGLLGLSSFVALNLIALKNMWRTTNPLAQACSLMLVSYLVFGLFDTIYWKNDLAALWWLVGTVVVVLLPTLKRSIR